MRGTQSGSAERTVGGVVIARRLGEILERKGLVTPDQTKEALIIQRSTGQLLGEVLRAMGLVTDADIAQALAESFGLPFHDLAARPPDAMALRYLPLAACDRCRALPLYADDGAVTVGIVDPGDLTARDLLRTILRDQEYNEVVVAADDYERARRTLGSVETVVKDMPEPERDGTAEAVAGDPEADLKLGQRGPAVKMLDDLLSKAVADRASDLHIGPEHDHAVVQVRVDGNLHKVAQLPREVCRMIVSRIKILAETDIANRLTPQDGHFAFAMGKERINVRVSTLPVAGGESVVLRFLKEGEGLSSLDHMGLDETTLRTLRELISRPQGMIVVTGPTGSGKSSTLYAALNEILAKGANVITIEDPVERNLPGVRQAQVNERAGLTFASALRSILRHDPDVIMVGETRDSETARIASQASLSGHLVLTTLHTNSALASVTRLVDIGLEPYLVGASLMGLYAQRLARVTCRDCGREAPIPEAQQDRLKKLADRDRVPTVELKGDGCEACKFSGYAGREAVGEIFRVDQRGQSLICDGRSETELREYARSQGMPTMQDAALAKIAAGVTTAAEALRVLPPVA